MTKHISTKRLILLPCIIAAAIALDQILKALVIKYLPLHEPTESFLGFRLHYTRNTGAAFSLFSERPLFLAVTVGVIISVCVFYLFFDLKRPYTQSVCIALICAGGLGNLVDRIRLGYVIDYIEPVFVRFAVFNFADMVLTCTVTVWAFLLFREIIKEQRILSNKT